MTDELEDFQYIIEDADFIFRMGDFNFYDRSFIIEVYKDRNLSLFNPGDIIKEVLEVVDRLKSMYNLDLVGNDELEMIRNAKSNNRYKESFLCNDGLYYFQENPVGLTIELVNIIADRNFDSLHDIECELIKMKFKQK